MIEGVDYAFSYPSATALAAAGKRFAMRYVGPGTSPKHLTALEARTLQAAGLSIVLLVEGAADSAKGGRVVGADHARQALAMCRERGFPTDRPFYFAVDYDVTAASWPAPREYLRGACDVLGLTRVGVYGECDAMAWAARDGVAAWFFQTYAWSGGRWYPGNHVEQYRNGVSLAGGIVDLCRAKVADYGQWPLSASDEGDDMDVNQSAELAAIFNAADVAKLDTNGDGKADQDFPVGLTRLLKDIRSKLVNPVPVEVDAAAVAAALAADTEFLATLAKAVNDDAARRLAG